MKLREWTVPPPIHLLKPEEIDELEVKWPVFKDDAHVDHLTGLPNRRAFDKAFSIAVKEATAQGRSFALMIFDLDHFKAVNDTHGHVTGDIVLKEFARRLSGSLRETTDFCSRYGGEEFGVLTVVSSEKTHQLGERVRLAVKALPISTPHCQPVTITCSFGYALFPFDAVTGASLLERADAALYKAKESGRDRGTRFKGGDE